MFTGGTYKPRLDWSRCLPSQSPQDILHSSWRRWPWHGSYWCKETLGTIFTFTPCGKYFLPVLNDNMYSISALTRAKHGRDSRVIKPCLVNQIAKEILPKEIEEGTWINFSYIYIICCYNEGANWWNSCPRKCSTTW